MFSYTHVNASIYFLHSTDNMKICVIFNLSTIMKCLWNFISTRITKTCWIVLLISQPMRMYIRVLNEFSYQYLTIFDGRHTILHFKSAVFMYFCVSIWFSYIDRIVYIYYVFSKSELPCYLSGNYQILAVFNHIFCAI